MPVCSLLPCQPGIDSTPVLWHFCVPNEKNLPSGPDVVRTPQAFTGKAGPRLTYSAVALHYIYQSGRPPRSNKSLPLMPTTRTPLKTGVEPALKTDTKVRRSIHIGWVQPGLRIHNTNISADMGPGHLFLFPSPPFYFSPLLSSFFSR